MATITKNEVLTAIKDINELIQYQPPITTDESKTVLQLKTAIEEKQKGEDKFIDKDFVPGGKNSLKMETVRQLRRLKIALPKTWEDKYLDALEAGTKDYEAPAEEKKSGKGKKPAVDHTAEEENPAKGEKAPEPKKPASKPEAKKPAAKAEKKTPAPNAKSEMVVKRTARIEALISKGIKKAELIEILEKEFETKPITSATMIADSKNPKYNKLSKLVVEEAGVLKFKK